MLTLPIKETFHNRGDAIPAELRDEPRVNECRSSFPWRAWKHRFFNTSLLSFPCKTADMTFVLDAVKRGF